MNEVPVNYFSHATAAERYAKFRPYFHPLIIERLARFTGCTRFENALDVACGTGNSTRALAEVASQVTGVDSSAAMLALAPALPNVTYQVASAEALPFADASFDLLTVVMAFHWFDQGRFLSEARRVLQPQGWLLIYNNVFLGRMKENPAFKDWVGLTFLPRYHTPPRARKKITAEYARSFDFELAGQDHTFNEVVMTPEQLTGYFLTQSNVIHAVEEGSENLDEVAAWIAAGIRPFFNGPSATMQFGSDLFFLRKQT